MKMQSQYLFEVPLSTTYQNLMVDSSDYSEGKNRKSRDPKTGKRQSGDNGGIKTGGVERIPKSKHRGVDDSPLLDDRIPGDKPNPKKPGAAVVGNQTFHTAEQARQAAEQAARNLGPGYSAIHEKAHQPGEQGHYHVKHFDGTRAVGHFFYGTKKTRHVDRNGSKKTQRGSKEFEFLFEAPFTPDQSPHVNLLNTKAEYRNNWLFELPYISSETDFEIYPPTFESLIDFMASRPTEEEKAAREDADIKGGELVKYYQAILETGGSGRSGGKGEPEKSAGAEMQRLAKTFPRNDPRKDAYKTVGTQLVNRGKAKGHKTQGPNGGRGTTRRGGYR